MLLRVYMYLTIFNIRSGSAVIIISLGECRSIAIGEVALSAVFYRNREYFAIGRGRKDRLLAMVVVTYECR